MADPRRQWLLRLYQRCGELRSREACLELLHSQAQAAGLLLSPHRMPAHHSLDHLAVALVHRMELAQAGLHVWQGALQPAGTEGPAQRLALSAARLLAGREELLLLTAALDGNDGRSGDAGALVDGETCARVAVAGFDPETELRHNNSLAALEAAGDVLAGGDAPVGTQYLMLGLKLAGPAAGALDGRRGRQPLHML